MQLGFSARAQRKVRLCFTNCGWFEKHVARAWNNNCPDIVRRWWPLVAFHPCEARLLSAGCTAEVRTSWKCCAHARLRIPAQRAPHELCAKTSCPLCICIWSQHTPSHNQFRRINGIGATNAFSMLRHLSRSSACCYGISRPASSSQCLRMAKSQRRWPNPQRPRFRRFLLRSASVCSTPRTMCHHQASRQEDVMQPHQAGSGLPSLVKWPAYPDQGVTMALPWGDPCLHPQRLRATGCTLRMRGVNPEKAGRNEMARRSTPVVKLWRSTPQVTSMSPPGVNTTRSFVSPELAAGVDCQR